MNSPIVLWAVDPFADGELQREALHVVQELSKARNVRVQPVYATSNLSEVQSAQTALNKIAAGKHVLPLQILQTDRNKQDRQVNALIEYALENSAELIVASTRARRALSRLLFGSFVELLSWRSPIPLLIVNPSWKRRASGTTFQDILFATDLSEISHKAYKEVLRSALAMKSRIHLFHKLVSQPLFETGSSYGVAYSDIWDEEVKKTKQQIAAWSKEGKAAGVTVTSEIDALPGEPVGKAILRLNERNGYLIAMAAQTGPIEAGILGSVTRQVMRNAASPVWVLHPKLAKVIKIAKSPRKTKAAQRRFLAAD